MLTSRKNFKKVGDNSSFNKTEPLNKMVWQYVVSEKPSYNSQIWAKQVKFHMTWLNLEIVMPDRKCAKLLISLFMKKLPIFWQDEWACEHYRAMSLLCKAMVLLKGLSQAGLQEFLQGGPGQGMGPHPVHLHTELEKQRLHKPWWLQETGPFVWLWTDSGLTVHFACIRSCVEWLTWTGRRILDVTLLPDSVSSWISRSSQLVAVDRMAPADSACSTLPNLSSSACHRNTQHYKAIFP